MSSSTSNSNTGLMVRSLIVAAAMFALYEGALRTGKVRDGNPGSFYAMNNMREEKFLYGRQAPSPVVMAGSSLTKNIGRYWKRADNLGFPYSDAMTGMILVEQGNRPAPKAMILEVNQPVINGVNESLVGIVRNPITKFTIKHVHAFRQTYQPYNVIRAYVAPGDPDNPPLRKRGPSSVRADWLKKFVNPMTAEEEKSTTKLLDEMGEEIKKLQAKGIKIYLVHIPTDPEVDATDWMKRFYALSEERLNPICNNWLRYSGPEVKWEAWDGLHLDPEPAKIYSEWLDGKMKEEGILP